MKTLMKCIPVATLTLAALLVLVGCQSDHSGHHGATAAKPYPLNKCIVTDEAFEHGKPVVFVHEGQEIKLCCKDCRPEFDKEPAKYLSKLSSKK
jgi:hypothetical protein